MNDQEHAHNGPDLIVTGSSAGGIDALRTLLAGLPSDLPASVVVAQHLDPTRPSHLDEILRQHSQLKLRVVEGSEALENGTVFVVPPASDVAIVDHKASVYLQTRAGAKPSIDRLFTTAAEFYGDRLIAVVLSGMGSDGLAGARSVKERGGTVIVQDPASASYPSLPLLIPPNLADFVARPEQMGSLITALLRRSEPAADGDGEHAILQSVLTEMRDRTGIDFLQYKTPTIMRRLSRLMIAAGCASLQEYQRHLQRHPDAYKRLVSAFLIKVTEFFRDPALFDELRTNVLPKLLAEAVATGAELRIWSAGSSTGEEPYSLAMLCADLVPNDGPQVRIFATDIDEDAIAFARRGIYGREALREVPSQLVQKYFIRLGDSYEVGKRIRNMTVFGQHDLAQRAPFPRIDLVLCRNVLIYFTKELQKRALQLFAFALRDKGYLVLGRAESTTPLTEYFQQVNGPIKIYERIGERILIPPTRLRDTPALGVNQGATNSTTASRFPVAPSRYTEFVPSAAETVGRFIFGSTLGIVVIDRRYDIVTLNPAARAMLQIHGIGVGDDLIHSAQGIDRERLRATVDAAFRGENPGAIDFELDTDPLEKKTVKLTCLYDATPASRTEAVAILLFDVTDDASRRAVLEKMTSENALRIEDLDRRIVELLQRQKSLLKANDDLTMSNADLRTANEQLLIQAEEVASSHEEVETLNEEMQATNEELETLNEELQATVEELNTTNDELQSRSTELEQMGAVREAHLLRVVREREALNLALQEEGRLGAIVDAHGQSLFIASNLQANGGETNLARLEGGEKLRLPEGEYRVTVRRIQADGEELRVVWLDRAQR